MDNLQRARVSLLINDDDLNPPEITSLLGAEPRRGVRKGETFIDHQREPIQARTGMWYFGSGYSTAPQLDAQISSILDKLTDNLEVWASLTSRYHCYVSVGGYFDDWTGGFTLNPATLGALSARGLSIDFDLYAPAASPPRPAD